MRARNEIGASFPTLVPRDGNAVNESQTLVQFDSARDRMHGEDKVTYAVMVEARQPNRPAAARFSSACGPLSADARNGWRSTEHQPTGRDEPLRVTTADVPRVNKGR